MSDNLSNYLLHLVPAVLPIALSNLSDKEATDTLLAIVGIRHDQKLASRRCGGEPLRVHVARSSPGFFILFYHYLTQPGPIYRPQPRTKTEPRQDLTRL